MPLRRREDLGVLKALPIARVAADLGIKLTPSGSARCPLPDHPDRRASFSLRAATNRFRCFGCARSGGVIDLVMLTLGMDFGQACRWLRERYSPHVSGRSVPVRRRTPIVPAPPRRSSAQPDPDIFRWVLDAAPLGPRGRAYLNGRAIGDATLAHFRVGEIGDCEALLQGGIERFGAARLARCGLVRDGQRGPRLVFPSGYLLFPFIEKDEVIFLQARRADAGTRLRWACPAELLPPVFNVDALGSDVSTVLICEGVTDVLSAHELGKTAIGVLGVSGRIGETVLNMLQAHNVVVLGDADRAGQNFGKRTVALLSRRGITAIMRPLPTGCNDINDYLRLQRSEAA